MKKRLSGLMIFTCFMTGCGTSKTGPWLFSKWSDVTIDQNKKDFIQLSDGTVVEDSVSDFQKQINEKKVILNGKRYSSDDISLSQVKGVYRRLSENEFLPTRIVKGKINVYAVENQGAPKMLGGSYSSSGVFKPNNEGRLPDFTLFFLQKGDDAPILKYSEKLFRKMINDNPGALAKYNSYDSLKGGKRRYMINIIHYEVLKVYNGKF